MTQPQTSNISPEELIKEQEDAYKKLIEDNRGKKIWQLIIHRPYEDISGLPFDRWCESKLICQHDADDKIKRTHCHIALIGVTVCEEAIRKLVVSRGLGGRGQFGIHTVSQEQRVAYDLEKLAVYMIKGEIANVKLSSYEEFVHVIWAKKWVRIPDAKINLKDGKLIRESPENSKPPTRWEILNEIRGKVETASDTEHVIRVIRDVLASHKLIMGYWKVLDYYDAYMMYERKEDFIEGLVSKIKSRG